MRVQRSFCILSHSIAVPKILPRCFEAKLVLIFFYLFLLLFFSDQPQLLLSFLFHELCLFFLSFFFRFIKIIKLARIRSLFFDIFFFLRFQLVAILRYWRIKQHVWAFNFFNFYNCRLFFIILFIFMYFNLRIFGVRIRPSSELGGKLLLTIAIEFF